MLHTSTLLFLKKIKSNNNKQWFEGHRADYEAAKNDFEKFVQSILDAHSKKDDDITTLKAKECMFRINRDVRFSKDKSPYKTNMGASLNRGGKKSVFAGYYLHCEPGQSFAGGGLWMPMPEDTKKLRQEIDYCYAEFKEIVSSKPFIKVYGDLNKDPEYSLVNIPKGYDKTNPAAEYLKLKSWVAMKKITDGELTSRQLKQHVLEAFETLQPLVKFINRAIEA
ncbi:MAG: DUF2461 domain-containing protein [Chitinophagaceae bacterium]